MRMQRINTVIELKWKCDPSSAESIENFWLTSVAYGTNLGWISTALWKILYILSVLYRMVDATSSLYYNLI